MSSPAYDPTTCGLCRSTSHRTILDIPNISMTSDDRLVRSGLRKLECLNCKLIRSGYLVSGDELRDHYETKYQLGQRGARGEPLFYSGKGPIPRSKVVFDWMLYALSQTEFADPNSILEIGCGEGSLLQQFAHYWKDCKVQGLDFNENSVQAARKRGLDVRKGGYMDVAGRYDLIFSFAVIEHVPSPSNFISVLKSHLSTRGTLLIAQPCQDLGSSDIFFSDHLWHFFSHHITEFGEQQGLKEALRLVGSKNIPNFSLHVFQHENGHKKINKAIASKLKIDQTLAEWDKIFEGINRWLRSAEERKLVVWGIGQTFALFHAYTSLKDYQISAAFEDNPSRYDKDEYNFQIMKFENRQLENDHKLRILLTFRPTSSLTKKLKEMSISYYSPFEEKT
jgi:SAM-dependent methyltransferase